MTATPEAVQPTTIVNVPSFLHKFAILQRKAKRLGLPIPTAIPVGPRRQEQRKVNTEVECVEGTNHEFYIQSVEVQDFLIDANPFHVSGFTLVAKLEPLPEIGRNVVIAISDRQLDLTRHAHTGCHCDHCGLSRQRATAYVLADEEGNTKQVGKGCLKSFFPNYPGNVVSAFTFQEEVWAMITGGADYEEGFRGSNRERAYGVDSVMIATIRAVATFGYISRKRAEEKCDIPTSSRVQSLLNDGFTPTDEERTEATELINWFAARNEDSDFSRTIMAYIEAGVVPVKRIGFIAAIKSCFDRDRVDKATSKVESQFVGEVGARIPFTATVLKVSSFGGSYGDRYITTMITPEGNLIKYWNVLRDADAGDTVEFSAQVKEHEIDSYMKGAKVTTVKVATKIKVTKGEAQ